MAVRDESTALYQVDSCLCRRSQEFETKRSLPLEGGEGGNQRIQPPLEVFTDECAPFLLSGCGWGVGWVVVTDM